MFTKCITFIRHHIDKVISSTITNNKHHKSTTQPRENLPFTIGEKGISFSHYPNENFCETNVKFKNSRHYFYDEEFWSFQETRFDPLMYNKPNNRNRFRSC